MEQTNKQDPGEKQYKTSIGPGSEKRKDFSESKSGQSIKEKTYEKHCMKENSHKYIKHHP